MTRAERRQLEFVLAAPHSLLRLEIDQTCACSATLAAACMDRAPAGVAVEIDGDPSRQDLDYTLARRALDAGCLLSLDSDAHSVGELEAAETAIAHPRLAGIPAERVINCCPLSRLLEWLDDRMDSRSRLQRSV